jgi:hypothetical protein
MFIIVGTDTTGRRILLTQRVFTDLEEARDYKRGVNANWLPIICKLFQ